MADMDFVTATAAARSHARISEAARDLDSFFGDDGDADCGWDPLPAAGEVRVENVCGVEPPPLAPVSHTLPALYRPLFSAIRQCISATETRAMYKEVEMKLELSQAISASKYDSLKDWLEAARDARQPVGFSYNRLGEIDFIWQVWPDSWVDVYSLPQNETVHRNLSLSIFLGAQNITRSIIENIVKLSKGFDQPVEARELARKLDWTDIAFLSWAIKEHKSKGFALAWHWEGEKGLVTIQSEERNVKKKKLEDAFQSLLKEEKHKRGVMSLDVLHGRLWEKEPNAFLLTHKADVKGVVEESMGCDVPLILVKRETHVMWLD